MNCKKTIFINSFQSENPAGERVCRVMRRGGRYSSLLMNIAVTFLVMIAVTHMISTSVFSQDAGTKAIIKMPTALTADSLRSITVPGRIHAIHIMSLNSDWRGGLYSTPDSPIRTLSEGLRSYENLYRSYGPGDTNILFAVTSFEVWISASEVPAIKAVFPDSDLRLAAEAAAPDVSAPFDAIPEKSGQADQTDTRLSEAAGNFVPSNAELNIQRLPNSDRRIDVTFSWNSNDDMTALTDVKAALEIQVLFANHASNPATSNLSFVGNMKSWGAEGISHAYFDTDAFNETGLAGSPEEREVAIGSYEARSDFRAGQQYRVWAITERGNLDANFAKLSFQRGTYKPNIFHPSGVYWYCRSNGNQNPANCVGGDTTTIVTPRNYTNTTFSIVAPTVPAFTYPAQACNIPPGYPYLGEGVNPFRIGEQTPRDLVPQILNVQRSFANNAGRSNVGCPSNFVHPDPAWWPRGGVTQDFDGGASGRGAILLAPNASQAFWIHGGIWTRYSSPQFGGPNSVVGEPTSDEKSVTSSRGSSGAYQDFTRGYLYYNRPRNQVYYVKNAIADKYRSVGLHTDLLGFPISDEYAWNGGARGDFEGGYIYWTSSAGAVIVRYLAPTVGSYTLNPAPMANQYFNVAPLNGTNFIIGNTQVFFCLTGTNTCYQQPLSLVTVSNAGSLTVTNVNLGVGSWQIYVQTPGGTSARSSSFNVVASTPPPTISNYSLSTTPRANQYFNVAPLNGTNFVVGNTQVFFCLTGTNTCYQQPLSLVTVSSASSLTVTNVSLGVGSWQIYVQTPGGTSARSSSFNVVASTPPPTISNYFLSTTPRANQYFNVAPLNGTNFITGGTKVYFCINGSSTCYQHPSTGVTVPNSSSLTASNVNLSAGQWQIYVQTAAGTSNRSSAFTVQPGPPTIGGYSWTSVPTGTNPFNGTISGSNFVPGNTKVFFCINGTSTCYQQPAAGVSVNNSSSLTVSNVRLSTGMWQFYLQTPNGTSSRSAAFTVR